MTVTTSPSQSQRLRTAIAAGKEAGAVALKYFQNDDLKVETKLDRSVVTRADREAETLLRRRIEGAFGDDAIVGEEHGSKTGTSGWTWYLDPIDGTQAYARGVPLFGTLIGALFRDQPMIGVILMPALGELVYAERGGGCFWHRDMRHEGDGRWTEGTKTRARVSAVARLTDAMFCTTWMQSFKASGRTELFTALSNATGVFRGWGDCYGYALVATGRAEIMVDPVLHAWDAGPMPVILEEAGGRYTSFAGEADIHAGNGFATNGHLHDAVQSFVGPT